MPELAQRLSEWPHRWESRSWRPCPGAEHAGAEPGQALRPLLPRPVFPQLRSPHAASVRTLHSPSLVQTWGVARGDALAWHAPGPGSIAGPPGQHSCVALAGLRGKRQHCVPAPSRAAEVGSGWHRGGFTAPRVQKPASTCPVMGTSTASELRGAAASAPRLGQLGRGRARSTGQEGPQGLRVAQRRPVSLPVTQPLAASSRCAVVRPRRRLRRASGAHQFRASLGSTARPHPTPRRASP